MAHSNPSRGYTLIRAALCNIGHEMGRNTIKRIQLNNGIDPSNRRDKGMSWATFLEAHWGAVAATDFFSVEVLTRRGLVRYFVRFFIDLKTRRVEIAGIVQQPDGRWMQQIARNVVDIEHGFLNECGYLVHDSDPLFTEASRALLASTGVTCLKLPARSPNLNTYAERFVRSIKYECLNRIIPLSERHLRTVVVDYTVHYHFERNHQVLDNRLIEKPRTVPEMDHPIHCEERVGGLLNYYYRAAA